jgi:hypothetical protein
MSQDPVRPKLSEKGLLTPDICAVAIIDLPPQMMFGVANFDRRFPSTSCRPRNRISEATVFRRRGEKPDEHRGLDSL